MNDLALLGGRPGADLRSTERAPTLLHRGVLGGLGVRAAVGRPATHISTIAVTPATVLRIAVILKNLNSKLLVGCPTLNSLGYASTKEEIELRAYDLAFPAVLPKECSSRGRTKK